MIGNPPAEEAAGPEDTYLHDALAPLHGAALSHRQPGPASAPAGSGGGTGPPVFLTGPRDLISE
jgi:hypothetical protein